MINILQQQEYLKDLSDEQIASEMKQPSGQMPLFLISTEAKRRADLRQRFKQDQAEAPQTTVQEDLLRSIMANQMQPPGGGGITQGLPQGAQQPTPQQAPQPQPQMAQQASPQQAGIMQGAPQGQGFAVGGEVRGFAGPNAANNYSGGIQSQSSRRGDLFGRVWDHYFPQGSQARLREELTADALRRAGGVKANPPIRGSEAEDGSIVEYTPPSQYITNLRLNPGVAPGVEDGTLMGSGPAIGDFNAVDTSAPPPQSAAEGALGGAYSARRAYLEGAMPELVGNTAARPQQGANNLSIYEYDPSKIDDVKYQGVGAYQAGAMPDSAKFNASAVPEVSFTATPAYKAGDMPARAAVERTVDADAEAKKRLAELRGEANPYADREARLAEREGDIASDRERNPWLALAEAGFSMAGGTSQHALENIGKGGIAGLNEYAIGKKELDARGDRAEDARSVMEGLQMDLDNNRKAESDRYAAGLISAEDKKIADLRHEADYALKVFDHEERGKRDAYAALVEANQFGFHANVANQNRALAQETSRAEFERQGWQLGEQNKIRVHENNVQEAQFKFQGDKANQLLAMQNEQQRVQSSLNAYRMKEASLQRQYQNDTAAWSDADDAALRLSRSKIAQYELLGKRLDGSIQEATQMWQDEQARSEKQLDRDSLEKRTEMTTQAPSANMKDAEYLSGLPEGTPEEIARKEEMSAMLNPANAYNRELLSTAKKDWQTAIKAAEIDTSAPLPEKEEDRRAMAASLIRAYQAAKGNMKFIGSHLSAVGLGEYANMSTTTQATAAFGKQNTPIKQTP
jgi:hypothetical protein